MTNVPSSYASGATLEEEGVAIPVRKRFDFRGLGVTAADDIANSQTVITVPGLSIPSTAKTAAYTLGLADAETVVEVNSASAATVTVPSNSSVAFPVGSIIEVYQQGVGSVTIAAGPGVTVRSRSGGLALAGIYAVARLRKRATDEWVLAGDLGPTTPAFGTSLPARIAESTGTVYYVNGATGQDGARTAATATNPATPFLTIQNAVDKVTALGVTSIAGGPIIEVAAAYASGQTSYVEDVVLQWDGDATHVCTLRGAAGSRPKISYKAGSFHIVVHDGAHYSRVRNFELIGLSSGLNPTPCSYMAGDTAACDHVEWDDVWAHGWAGSSGVAGVQGFFSENTVSYVQRWNCMAYDIGTLGVTGLNNDNYHGFYNKSSNSYSINCLAHHIHDGWGFHHYSGTGNPTTLSDINCTAAYCTSALASGFLIDDNYIGYVARNCIAANNGNYGFQMSYYSSTHGGSNQTVQNCLTFGNGNGAINIAGGSPATQSGNLTGDPAFTGTTNFHIATSGAAFNAGAVAYCPASDIEGSARATADCGAYKAA